MAPVNSPEVKYANTYHRAWWKGEVSGLDGTAGFMPEGFRRAPDFLGCQGRFGHLPPGVCLQTEDSGKRGSSTKKRCCSEFSRTFQMTPGAVLQETEFPGNRMPHNGFNGRDRNAGAADRGG